MNEHWIAVDAENWIQKQTSIKMCSNKWKTNGFNMTIQKIGQ